MNSAWFGGLSVSGFAVWFDRLTMSGSGAWFGGRAGNGCGWHLVGEGVGLTEGFEVGAAEGLTHDVGVEDGFQLALGFVLPALMDGEGRGGMRGGATQ